jgi:hypothetical protein
LSGGVSLLSYSSAYLLFVLFIWFGVHIVLQYYELTSSFAARGVMEERTRRMDTRERRVVCTSKNTSERQHSTNNRELFSVSLFSTLFAGARILSSWKA